jgi:hypothetical protein
MNFNEINRPGFPSGTQFIITALLPVLTVTAETWSWNPATRGAPNSGSDGGAAVEVLNGNAVGAARNKPH